MKKKSTTTEKEKLGRGVRERTYLDSKGKTHIRYEKRFTWKGVRYSAYGDTPTKAEDAADEMRLAMKAGTYRKNNAVTVSEYFEEWKAQKTGTVKDVTIWSYEKRFRLYMQKPLGRYKVKDLERRQVVKAIKEIADKVSVHAANMCKSLLVQVLRGAVYDEIVAVNVAENIPNIKEKEGKVAARDSIHRALNDEEIKAFMGAAKGSWFFPAFQFMLATGVRAGECGGLEWKDIDTKKGVIHIQRTITRDKEGHLIVGTTTKTKRSRRDIPLNKEIIAILEKQKEQFTILLGNVIAIDGRVFPNTKGGIAEVDNFNSAIRASIRRYDRINREKSKEEKGIEIQPFSVHAFRDTFASKAAANGVPLNVLKELLGHSSYAMTADLYGHIYEEQKKQAMDSLKLVVM